MSSYQKIVLRVPHGCNGDPTKKVCVIIPDGVISVKPKPVANWMVEIKKGDYAKPYTLHNRPIISGIKEVIWTGHLEDGYFEEFMLMVRLTDRLLANENIYFKTIQECPNGTSEWVEIPPQGGNPHHLKRPAPALKILPAKAH